MRGDHEQLKILLQIRLIASRINQKFRRKRGIHRFFKGDFGPKIVAVWSGRSDGRDGYNCTTIVAHQLGESCVLIFCWMSHDRGSIKLRSHGDRATIAWKFSAHRWRDESTKSLISHGLVSKIILNLPIWWKCIELKGIMVNKGRIHREIRKFLMYSLKLIKSEDELMIEIGENDKLWEITSNRFQGFKNHRIWTWFRGEIKDWSGEKISES